MKSTLSRLQLQILRVLSTSGLSWTLTGGGALAGFHLGHRMTDDLDLFFHGTSALDREPRVVRAALAAAGMTVTPLVEHPGFVRLSVEEGDARVVVDLVAEPVAWIEAPLSVEPGISVDTPHEILVNKLCALVSRSELRDLEDVRALTAAGGDLPRALADAPRKDGGFSPMTLAWLIGQLDFARAAELGFDGPRLRRFRDELLDALA